MKLSDALSLAAHAPGNADYVELLDAACTVATARSELECAELATEDAVAEAEAALDRVVGALARLENAMKQKTAADASMRLKELRTGVGQ